MHRLALGFFVVLSAFGLAACSGGRSAVVPATSSGTSSTAARTMDSAYALPGDSAHALPGDSAHALPGASLACPLSAQPGQASCSLAINVNINPIADATTPASLIPGLHPSDLQAAYGFAPSGSSPLVAAVVAGDAPAVESDLAVYRSAFGLGPCSASSGCLQRVNERGSTTSYPAANAGWAQEATLDLEMLSAICPSCRLVLVEADSPSIDDLGTAVDTAVVLGARVVSNSYYASEWSGESNEDVHYRHEGVALTVAAGDSGVPTYPAVSTFVTAVGGTTRSGSTESPWTYGGQGCSAYVSRPPWQPAGPCTTRSAVDLAVVGDPQTGVAMFQAAGGGWLVAGGTSVGAPIVAGAYALAGPQPIWYAYAHPAAFHDIGATGYDNASGLGTPNGLGAF